MAQIDLDQNSSQMPNSPWLGLATSAQNELAATGKPGPNTIQLGHQVLRNPAAAKAILQGQGMTQADVGQNSSTLQGIATALQNPAPDSSQSALDQLRAHAAQIAAQGPPQRSMDLSGLATASDLLNKNTDATTGYKNQQENEENQIKNNQDFQKGILDTQRGLVNPFHYNPNGEYDKFFSGVQGDHLLSDALKAKSQFDGAQNLVNQNTNIAGLMAKGELLHAAFGRVNQTEYQNAAGDPGVANTVQRLWNKYNIFASTHTDPRTGQMTADPSQIFTPTDQADFKNAINSLSDQANKTVQQHLEIHHQDALSKGIDPSRYMGLLQAYSPGFGQTSVAPQSAAQAPMTPQQKTAATGTAPKTPNVPAGMKLQRNKTTGATRLVPIDT